MFNRIELKQLAKDQLKGKWGNAVLITFVYAILTGIVGSITRRIPSLGVFSILLSAPLSIGLLIAYINFVKTSSKLQIEDLFSGFKIYLKALGIYLWNVLWIVLWSMLFLIPGIIKAIAYSQSMYIIADNQNVKVRDAMKTSIKMTQGYKGDIFVMFLSFLGWGLLCILSLGIGFLWLIPYMNTSFTNLFFKLKEMSIKDGRCSEGEFDGSVSLTY